MIHEETGFNIFIKLIKQFITSKIPNLQKNQIYHLVMDSSDNEKFSRHLIIRIFNNRNEELIYKNNYNDCKKHLLEFRDYFIHFVFNRNNQIYDYGDINHTVYAKYLRKYEKNLPESLQNDFYSSIADQFFLQNDKYAGSLLTEGMYFF